MQNLLAGKAAKTPLFLNCGDVKNLIPALLAACVAIVLLVINVSGYTFNNKKWLVEPALVADRSGARLFGLGVVCALT